jgi:hypothetical protein
MRLIQFAKNIGLPRIHGAQDGERMAISDYAEKMMI